MRIVHGWTLCALVGIAQGCSHPAADKQNRVANYIAPPQPMAITQPSASPNGIQQAGHQTGAASPNPADMGWGISPPPKLAANVPADEPRQVIATWQHFVAVTEDSQNQGKPLPGLTGRMYFMGAEVGHSFQALGRVTVTLHEIKPDGQMAVNSEVWKIDGHTLQNLLRKDFVGWGYTLFLPWSTMRPDINQVRLQIKFEPLNGAPIYSRPTDVTVRQDPGAAPIVNSQIVPTKSP